MARHRTVAIETKLNGMTRKGPNFSRQQCTRAILMRAYLEIRRASANNAARRFREIAFRVDFGCSADHATGSQTRERNSIIALTMF
jgi:hypothetical protein